MASQANDRAPYVFKRDFRSSIRLNYNHWMMKELLGYLINPKIQYDKRDVHIADIGTGTALWPLEVANDLSPSAQIDGFDISSAQYPPGAWCATNVNLITHDAFKPFPQLYLGKYDIVHIRFFATIVNNENAEPLLENLIALLKPGGYLQWVEPFPMGTRALAADPSATSTASVEQLVQLMRKPKANSTSDWIAQLPDLFQKHGLHPETYEKVPMKDTYRLIWGQSSLAGLEDVALDAALVGVEKAEQTRKLMDGLSAEFAQGVSLDTTWVCAVARKSS